MCQCNCFLAQKYPVLIHYPWSVKIDLKQFTCSAPPLSPFSLDHTQPHTHQLTTTTTTTITSPFSHTSQNHNLPPFSSSPQSLQSSSHRVFLSSSLYIVEDCTSKLRLFHPFHLVYNLSKRYLILVDFWFLIITCLFPEVGLRPERSYRWHRVKVSDLATFP